MNIARKIGYNFLVRITSGAIGLVLALFSLGFITRTIGNQGYGQYSLVLAFLVFFQIAADFGLQTLLTREISKKDAAEKDIVSNFFTLRLATSLFLVIPAPLLALLFPYSSVVKVGIVVAVLGSFFSSLSSIFLAVFQKHLRTDFCAIAETLGRLIQFALFAVGLKMRLGLFWFLLAYVASSFVIFAVNFFFVRRIVKFSLKIDAVYWKRVLRWSLPVAVSLLFTMIYFKIDTLMLGFFKSEAEVGFYGFAYKILEILISFAAIFVGLVMPFLSQYAVESLDVFKKIFQKAFNLLAISALPIFFGGIILAKPLIVVLGGADFAPSAPALQILLGAMVIIFFGTLAASAAVALNQQKKAAWAYGLGAIFNIIANLVFIPKYSYIAASATTVATEFLVTIFLFWVIYREIKYFPAIKVFWKAMLASLAMFGGLYLFGGFVPVTGLSVHLALSLVSGAIIYGGVIWFAGGVPKSDLGLLFKR